MTPNLDRFRDVDDEPKVTCGGCDSARAIGDMEYDDHSENYFCDRSCFGYWASHRPDIVEEYYYERNVGY